VQLRVCLQHALAISERNTDERSGIGKATAFGLAKHGIKHLALTDISQKNLLETSEAIKSQYSGVEIESINSMSAK
jgi:NAD(P)-dependent dehydrogenase (short-subunit alcohol dehydrogenase family)